MHHIMSLYFYVLTLFFWLCFLTNNCDCEDFGDLSDIFSENLSLEENQKKCEVKEINSGSIKKCQFPFIFQNQTFYGCTTFGAEGIPWCSTKIDALDFQHVGGKGYYGDCPLPLDICPSAENGLNAENSFIQTLELSYQEENTGDDFGFRAEDLVPDCSCEDVKTCKWSKRMILNIHRQRLPRNHPTRKKTIKFVKTRVCKDGNGKKSVYCCEGGDYPTRSQLKVLESQEKSQVQGSLRTDFIPIPGKGSTSVSASFSGKWKPNGMKGECGQQINFSNIVGGSITKSGDFPYMALLGSKGKSSNRIQYTCGGSLINKWYVLTAAHCLYNEHGELAKPDEVLLGEHIVGRDPDCTTNGDKDKCAPKRIMRRVQKFKIHEKWQNSNSGVNKYDIALLRLDEPVPLFEENPQKSFATPVCLPWNENDIGRRLEDGDHALITGWGRITNDLLKANFDFIKANVATRILRKVKVPILSNEVCAKFQLESDSQICAGGVNGKDSCSGDSGGPLVYREFTDDPWYQTGIVSFGFGDACGVENVPGVYTRVEAYLSWIESNLED